MKNAGKITVLNGCTLKHTFEHSNSMKQYRTIEIKFGQKIPTNEKQRTLAKR
jgi:hypothetical protein